MSNDAPRAAAGWYPNPKDPTQVRYWDGQQWVGDPASAPGTAGSPAASENDVIGSIFSYAKRLASNKKHQGTAMSVAGGAAIAEGAIGRNGIGKGIGSIVTGIVTIILATAFIGVANDALSAGVKPMQPTEQQVSTEVVDIEWTAKRNSTATICKPVIEVESVQLIPKQAARTTACPIAIGDSIDVFYVPGQPDSARVDPAGPLGAQALGSSLIGLIQTAFYLVGGLTILGGIFKLLRSLGIIAGGSFLLFKGLQRRRAHE